MAKKTGNENSSKNSIADALKQANALRQSGRLQEAMRAYQVLLGYAPDFLPALYNLGQVHRLQAEYHDAEYCFRRMLHTAPDDLEAMTALAATCLEIDQTDEARDLAARAASLSKAPFIQLRTAVIMRRAGDLKAAQEMAECAIAQDPKNIDAYYTLSTLKKFSADDTEFKNLISLGEGAAGLPDAQRIRLEFALGKAMLDTGNDAAAFAHYETGNRLQRIAFKHVTVDLVEKYVDSIISLFTPELVARHAQTGAISSDRPLFIVGMPRSGSTLTEHILSSHPQVRAMGEVLHLQNSLPAYANTEVPGLFAQGLPSVTRQLVENLSPQTLDQIGQKYLQLTEPFAKNSARLTDKMLFNFFYVGIIRLALPNAAIIHCTRDPMATGLSIWQNLFHAESFWTYNLADIGRYTRAYQRLMAHWNDIFPGMIFEANYETMVANQESETRRLLDYCGLPWDARCLDFKENDRSVATASTAQVRQGLYTASLSRWKKYEQYLAPLHNALKGTT
jgi:tetratricopeptide (TPR) repeat protein